MIRCRARDATRPSILPRLGPPGVVYWPCRLFNRCRARRSRLSGAPVGPGPRAPPPIRRNSTSSGVGGGVTSSYSARASAFGRCWAARVRTTTCCIRPCGRLIERRSPGAIVRCGFARWSLTSTLPPRQARWASERVLNRQATSSHTSSRTGPGVPSLSAGLTAYGPSLSAGRGDRGGTSE